MRSPRPTLVAILALAGAFVVFRLATAGPLVPNPEDFRAFYCAGEAVAHHRDSYLAEPLRSCEVREIAAAGYVAIPGLVDPAPLPGYDLAAFAALSLLPFASASNLFTLAVILAVAVSTILISQVARVPVVAPLAALALADCSLQIIYGQIAGFAILALCLAAWALMTARPGVAGACVALAAIEPHVALPAVLALGLFVPRSRLALVAVLLAFGAISLATTGAAGNLEYLTRVLPAQARAETTAYAQYGLTTVLSRLNTPPDIALSLGSASYVATIALGLAAARGLVRRFGAPEAYALVPPAFAMFGGSYIHSGQIAVSLPAMFLLARLVPERRGFVAIPMLLVAIPWRDVTDDALGPTLLAVAVVSATISSVFWPRDLRRIAAGVALAVTLGAGEHGVRSHTSRLKVRPTIAGIAAVASGGLLAEATWQRFSEEHDDAPASYWLTGLPTWLGLGLFVVSCTIAGTRSRLSSVELSANP